MIQQLLHICVSQVSLSNAHHVCQNVEIWIIQGPFGVPTLYYIRRCTHFRGFSSSTSESTDLYFLAFGGSSTAAVFFIVAVDPVFVSLRVLVVKLNGRSLNFVDPQ